MLSFEEYTKVNKTLNTKRGKKMYETYVKGEEEIMGQSLTLGDMLNCKKALASANTQNIQFVSNSINMTPAQFYGLECSTQEQEGTTPMNTNSERDYLNRRVTEVYRTLDRALEKQFHLGENTNPKTYKEMIDWIKNDKFEIDKKMAKYIEAIVEDGGQYYGTFIDGIVWTGAGFKIDRDGYNVARDALLKALQEAKDVINTSDAADGLKALKEFEGWEYVAPKKKH